MSFISGPELWHFANLNLGLHGLDKIMRLTDCNSDLTSGVSLQPLPWPPLVTACDVMPLVAADMTRAAVGELSCASSGIPDCETIYCNVESNSEQLQIDLLPCWEYPALWLRTRLINGTPHIQHIFYKDFESFEAKIGYGQVTLNVTLVQRNKLTLGVEVRMIQLCYRSH